MIIRCHSEFPEPETKRQDYFIDKRELLEWVSTLPDNAKISTDSVIEAEWLETRNKK